MASPTISRIVTSSGVLFFSKAGFVQALLDGVAARYHDRVVAGCDQAVDGAEFIGEVHHAPRRLVGVDV